MSAVIERIIEELQKQVNTLEVSKEDGDTFRALLALVEPDSKITIRHDDRAGYAVVVNREHYYALTLQAAIKSAIHFEGLKRHAQTAN